MSDRLTTISYTDESAKEIVERFCDRVHWLVEIRHTYKVLFEDEIPSCQTLMSKTAPSFFTDLNRILQEYLLLESAKITDPATTRGDENFTVDYIIQKINWPDDPAVTNRLISLPQGHKSVLNELEALRAITDAFRNHIKTVRNKLLAHLDKKAVLSKTPLGLFPEGDDETFLDALQKICNITHEICFDTICGDMIPTHGGDVINLRRTLKEALAYRKALSESSGQEKTRLLLLFQDAGHELNA
jgi:hypothetical protein